MYQVVWRPLAEEQLARAWMAVPDKAAVTSAAHAIDVALARDPRSVGEGRTGMTRILIEQPLAALFEIVEDDQRVFVLTVWLT